MEIREILEATGMAKTDIERHIKDGVFVYCDDEREDYIDDALNCGFDLLDATEMWERMDVVVMDNCNRYHLDFVL